MATLFALYSLYLHIMSRRIYAILLSLLLLIPTIGVSLEKHFCGDHLADVAFFTGAGCGCDEEEENDDCCHEENEMYQMNLEQFSASVQRLPHIAEHDLLLATTIIKPIEELLFQEAVSFLQDPPPPQTVPHYRMNCSFTFYG